MPEVALRTGAAEDRARITTRTPYRVHHMSDHGRSYHHIQILAVFHFIRQANANRPPAWVGMTRVGMGKKVNGTSAGRACRS